MMMSAVTNRPVGRFINAIEGQLWCQGRSFSSLGGRKKEGKGFALEGLRWVTLIFYRQSLAARDSGMRNISGCSSYLKEGIRRPNHVLQRLRQGHRRGRALLRVLRQCRGDSARGEEIDALASRQKDRRRLCWA